MKNTLPENEKAIFILKTQGPLPLADIAEKMEVTREGARFHLLKLEREGLVEARSEVRGRGRPKQIWSLSDSGNSRFPNTHEELTVNLIRMMRETLGESAVQKVIETHEKRVLLRYAEELKGCGDLERRISRLADIRTREGYMAEYEVKKDGYLFIENHCPICAAATSCQSFCSAEMNIFRSVLGEDVEIERVEHIVAGARRCAYRITRNSDFTGDENKSRINREAG